MRSNTERILFEETNEEQESALMIERQEHHIKVERTARYYTLGNEANKTKEMWVVLHGYRNLARSFIEWFSPIATAAFIVAPEALSRFYTKGTGGPDSSSTVGASWMTREDRLNEIQDHVAYFDRLYETTTEARPEKLILLGFSQGCPAVLRWTANGKIKPDHVLIWSGDVPRDLDFQRYKAKSDELKTWMVYGNNDTILEEGIYKEGEMLLQTHGIPHASILFSGSHEIKADTLVAVRKQILAL
jgi:predicted esterase